MIPAVFGETVTVVRQVAGKHGQTTDGPSHQEANVAVWEVPGSSTETTTNEDVVAWTLTSLWPATADLLPTDRVVVRGISYQVVGRPILHRSSITGRRGGLEVTLKTWTG